MLTKKAIVYCYGIFVTVLLSSEMMFSQDEDQLKERIVQLALFKNADDSRTAVATLRQEGFNDRMIAGRDVNMKFYAVADSTLVFLDEITTGPDGKAQLLLPKPVPLDTSGSISILVESEADTFYTATEDQIVISDCIFSAEISERDSMRYVTTSVTRLSDGQPSPVEDVEVSFYVKRLFGYMPISEYYRAYTDENGIAEIVFPEDIKGDTSGTVMIVSRIEDDDYFGNVEKRIEANWGIPVKPEVNPFPRALWMPKAPYSLIVPFSIIFGAIWGLYFFVMYLLRQINNEVVSE